MELQRLRSFVAVAGEQHFGRAAAQVHITQPALSQQIRALERELGVRLLDRTTRRVELTPAGAAYLARATALLADVEAAAHEARQVAAGLTGRLAIGCVGSATYSVLPVLARRLTADLPGIEFAFRGEMLVPAQVEGLRSGEIDLALTRPPAESESGSHAGHPGVRMRRLRRDELVAVLAADHPLAARRRVRVADMRDIDLVAHRGRADSVMRALLVSMCRKSGFEPRIRHEVEETSTLVTLAAAGLGVAVAPAPVSALALPGVEFRPLSGAPAIDLAVGVGDGRDEPHLLRAVEAVVEILHG